MTLLFSASAILWLTILLLPWRPWSTRESLDAVASADFATSDLSDLTVLIPARNEAETILTTLQSLTKQGHGLKIIVVDDQSTDGTAELTQQSGVANVRIIPGSPLPAGWSGKLWALEQGRPHVKTGLVLLLDADIHMQAGIVVALLNKMRDQKCQFISLMAHLRMIDHWEKLLLPAFVYFFKLVYPFRLANNTRLPWIAAAAGGCILMKTHILTEIQAFHSLRDALIDDCTLARKVKAKGYKTWIGLTHSVISQRDNSSLGSIWDMVARTAFTQLQYSIIALIAVSLVMVLAYWSPVVGLTFDTSRLVSLTALAAMMLSYLPVLRYYQRSPLWVLLLPLVGTLFLAMTWTSALRYWRGQRSTWKQRVYDRELGADSADTN